MSGPSFIIEGGCKISGTIRPSGNKNAALPLIAATLLSDEEVILRNVPAIRDVQALLEIVQGLGATVRTLGPGVVAIKASGLNGRQPEHKLAKAIRASILLAGPMVARRGHVRLPPPGGDVIGRRRIDTHVLALTGLGAEFDATHEAYEFRAPKRLQGAELFLDEASVTGTENALMAAALAQGRTVIMNAASEPHVQDLCQLLVKMGAKISGIGTNTITIDGVDRLKGADHTVGPDYIEVGSLIVLAAVTGGELTIVDSRPLDHRSTRIGFGRLGINFEATNGGRDILVPGGQRLSVQADLFGAVPKVEDAPWPGFPADLTSLAVVAATQSEGTTLIHQKMFESRLFFVDRLSSMGARIILCDPHRCVITGKSPLFAQELVSPDIRAGMALLIAALTAKGKSVIQNVGQIDRGYERIDERLNALGAKISRKLD